MASTSEIEMEHSDTGDTDTDPSDLDDADIGLGDTGGTSCLGGMGHSASDIKIEYHKHSSRECETLTFEEFTTAAPVRVSPPPAGHEPWAPFRTREDFEFAELTRDTRMTRAQVDTLIGLFCRCIENGKDSFTLSSYNEMRKTLEVASERLPKVCLYYPLCFV